MQHRRFSISLVAGPRIKSKGAHCTICVTTAGIRAYAIVPFFALNLSSRRNFVRSQEFWMGYGVLARLGS
jgi:hypothetical protein